jgi:hypothetical protein
MVPRDGRIGVLIDGDPSRCVGYVDDHRSAPFAGDHVAHVRCDLEKLAASLGSYLDLVQLQGTARGWRRAHLQRALPACLTAEVFLDLQQIALSALDDVEQISHRGHLFPLFLKEPVLVLDKATW